MTAVMAMAMVGAVAMVATAAAVTTAAVTTAAVLTRDRDRIATGVRPNEAPRASSKGEG